MTQNGSTRTHFPYGDVADAETRKRVLDVLTTTLHYQFPSPEYETFKVERTNNRKGYRDTRAWVNDSPYQSDPKVKVTIEVELPDDINPDMTQIVADLTAREVDARKAAAQAQVDVAATALEAARKNYDIAVQTAAKVEEEVSK